MSMRVIVKYREESHEFSSMEATKKHILEAFTKSCDEGKERVVPMKITRFENGFEIEIYCTFNIDLVLHTTPIR